MTAVTDLTATKVLVTGATGQDGSYLVERLLADGAEVHTVSRDASDVADTVGHRGDLSDPEGLTELIARVQPEIVFNLAGVSSVAISWERPVETTRANGTAVVAILDACHALQAATGRDVRVVQASSSEIFGNARRAPQSESTPISPVSPYGASKALAHHAVGVYRGRGLFCSSAILYNHESPRRPETFVTRKITMGVARIAAGLEDALSLGNLDARRDWGWAPDYVDAMLRMAGAGEPDDFVVATGETHSVRDFVGAAFRAAGIPDWEGLVQVDPRFLRPADVAEMRGDASHARAVLGWEPTRGFDDIVAAMVENDLAAIGH